MDSYLKLDNDQLHLTLRMFAEGYSIPNIRKELSTKFNINISRQSILLKCEAKGNQQFIKDYRETYLAKVREVPIANKRIRIDDLEMVRTRLIKLLKENKCENKSQKAEYLTLSRELRALVESAREEMERKPHLISNTILNMNEVSDGQLHSRKEELVRKAQRVIGGGASRIDPDRGGIEPEDSPEPS